MKSNQAADSPGEQPYRQLLQGELARRCTNNAQYSLRAFARDLDTDHSTLSQLIRGRRTLTERHIRKFSATLGLSPEEIQKHVLREGRRASPATGRQTVRVLRELTEDAVAVISEFEHYAILELTHLDEFRPDVSWIARVLGVPPDTVNVAIHRLLRLELMKMVSQDQWEDCTGDVTNLLGGVAYEAVRRLSERARAYAIETELQSPAEEREYSSTTIAVNRSRLPEALRILSEARNEVLRVLAEGERRDGVYQLEVALLPLTRNHSPGSGKETEHE